MTEPGHVLWAARQLLDRQLVDANDMPAGKVDDLELTFPSEPGALPTVTTILCGPAALARRFGGRLGSSLETMHSLVYHGDEPAPAEVPFGLVKQVGVSVLLTVGRDDLRTVIVEDWLRDHFISNIPGSGKDPGVEK
jgi:hypothetical protein